MFESRVIWIFVALLLVGVGGQTQTMRRFDCTSPTQLRGWCVSLFQCPPLMALMRTVPLSDADMNFLRRSQCGLVRSVPQVCCVPELS